MHTPGPWVVDDTEYIDIVAPAGRVAMLDSDALDHRAIAANARLIAAAPLMLEALRQCESALYGLGDDYRIDSAWSRARAAIEAATKE